MMTVREVGEASPSIVADSGVEIAEPLSICCAYIGPTVLPARIKRGVVDGSEFGERMAELQIV
jgi:hypothetical protein